MTDLEPKPGYMSRTNWTAFIQLILTVGVMLYGDKLRPLIPHAEIIATIVFGLFTMLIWHFRKIAKRPIKRKGQ